MKVYLSDAIEDPREPDRSEWFKALSEAFGSSFIADKTITQEKPPDSHCAYGEANAVLFVHSTFPGDWRLRADEVNCHIVLVRSGGLQQEERNARGNLHGCYWHPRQFRNECAKVLREVALFIGQIRIGDSGEIDWNLLRPAPDTHLALRILCEAWKFTEGRASNADGNVNVCAPTTAVQWFEPFGKQPAELNDAVGIAELIVGDEKSKAKTLLEAVFSNAAENLGNEIDEFLAKSCETSKKSKDLV